MPRWTLINLSDNDPSTAAVESFTSTASARPQTFYRESDLEFFLSCLLESGDETGQTPFTYLDLTGWQIIVAAGSIGLKPTGGTFTLTDSAAVQTTGAINFDATAEQVQVAVRNALTTNWALAVVSGSASGPFTVTNGANGDEATLTVTATSLQPANSTVIVTNTQEGTAGLPEQGFVELARALPIGRSSGWTPLPPPLVTITTHTAGDATHNKVFKIVWNADAIGGDVQFRFLGSATTTSLAPVAYNATAEEMGAAFFAHGEVGTNGVAVTKTKPGEYYVTCLAAAIDLSNTPTLTESSNSLVVPLGVRGFLKVNTAGVSLLLNGEESATITFEVRINRGNGWEIVAQQKDATLYANLIRATNGVATAIDPTPTLSEVSVRLTTVTGYTGGGPTNLDGISTTGLAVGRCFFFVHATLGKKEFQLVAGTDAEASPGIIRPDDYDAGTNAKVWKSI